MLVILTVIGALVVVKYVVWLLWNPAVFLCRTIQELVSRKTFVEKYGSWAVVTGSTDGIGKHYAMELARRGVNIVLISRNPQKLGNVATEIESSYNVKTRIIVADFTQGTEIYTHIEQELQDIPVGILVNNVGMATEHPTRFCSESLQRKLELMRVNTMAVTAMTRLLLPAMLNRRCGAVVNVASAAGAVDCLPHAAVYAATKAYICHLTASIQGEYARSGVHIQTLTPFFVSSNMTAFSDALHRGNLFVPSARVYARHAVATLGKLTNTSGYWTHGLQMVLLQTLPVWLQTKVVSVFTYFIMIDYKRTQRINDEK
ncbi:inactive hydroxysteroid dehydrogenase-like protein 1 [Aricia agestis]|uniref:inactive hydroxysteroid dehydrogenase-like protein 1 n=1 Tax=Aricia agestis TaxID=91739 RepID=UPI001C2020EB|nr:inactive hydroxysteroid dehydrogenase-like protein 1 [Aricia agestis]